MPEALIPSVMEMLREESPVTICYNQSQLFLCTGNEPIARTE